jgi:hypothetical protein
LLALEELNLFSDKLFEGDSFTINCDEIGEFELTCLNYPKFLLKITVKSIEKNIQDLKLNNL